LLGSAHSMKLSKPALPLCSLWPSQRNGSLLRLLIAFWCVFSEPTNLPAAVIAQWNFNSRPPDANTRTGSISPSLGTGTAVVVGGVSQTFFTGSSIDPAGGSDNSGWSISSFPPQGTGNKLAGVQFNVSTLDKRNIMITWAQQVSPTASRYSRLQYSTNRSDFIDSGSPVVMRDTNSFESQTVTLVGIAGVNDNANFAFRLVTEFEATAIGTTNSNYVTASISDYNTVGRLRFDMVTVSGEPISPTLSSARYSTNALFQFNISGTSGFSYIAQASTNLVDWVSLKTNVSPFTFTDANAVMLPNRFYRAVYLP